MENKIKDLKGLKCYILEFKCKKATPGRHIVVAYNADDALKIFKKLWISQFEAGEVDIPITELESLSIQEWCDYWTGMLGRY